MADKNLDRLFKGAKERVVREWSGPAFEKLGSRVQRALLAEEILRLAAQQDDSISAETVRKIVGEGWSWSVDEAGY